MFVVGWILFGLGLLVMGGTGIVGLYRSLMYQVSYLTKEEENDFKNVWLVGLMIAMTGGWLNMVSQQKPIMQDLVVVLAWLAIILLVLTLVVNALRSERQSFFRMGVILVLATLVVALFIAQGALSRFPF